MLNKNILKKIKKLNNYNKSYNSHFVTIKNFVINHKTNIALIVILFFFIFNFTFFKIWRGYKQQLSLLQKTQILHNEIRDLETQIKILHEDNEYIELLARKKLGLIKSGETIYRFSEINE